MTESTDRPTATDGYAHPDGCDVRRGSAHGRGCHVIVSHEHEFVFLKTRKTAGTSIEVALARMIEPGAIVTSEFGPVVGTHTGPAALGFVAYAGGA